MPGRRRRLADGALALEPRRSRPAGRETPATARTKLDESLELARLIDDTRGIGIVAGEPRLGRAARRRSRRRLLLLRGGGGDRTAARASARSAPTRSGASPRWPPPAATPTVRRASRGPRSRSASPAGFDPTASIPFARHLDDARAALGEHAWQKAWAEGAELDFDAALRPRARGGRFQVGFERGIAKVNPSHHPPLDRRAGASDRGLLFPCGRLSCWWPGSF